MDADTIKVSRTGQEAEPYSSLGRGTRREQNREKLLLKGHLLFNRDQGRYTKELKTKQTTTTTTKGKTNLKYLQSQGQIGNKSL